MYANIVKQIGVEEKRMKVHVSSSLGQGATSLAAFDQALIKTGVANYNLIRLSSVLPPNAEVIEHDGPVPALGSAAWGDRLYVVYAEQRVEHHGEEAWAGVGWVQDPETGKGLFVEHEGHSEHHVKSDIEASLKGLLMNRGMKDLPIRMRVVGGVCEDQPICAFAVVAYQASSWENSAYFF